MSENWAEKFARLTDFERSQMLVWNEYAYWAEPHRIMSSVMACAQVGCCTGCGSQLPTSYWTSWGAELEDTDALRMLVQHICQSCGDFTLCGICGLNATCMFPGHEMAKIDLRWLVKGDSTRTPQKQSMSLLIATARLMQLKAGFCLTCLDAHPGNRSGQRAGRRERFFEAWGFFRWPSTYDLYLSGERGCPICAMLWRGVALCVSIQTLQESGSPMNLTINDTSLGFTMLTGEGFKYGSFRRDANSQSSEHEWPKLEVARNFENHFGSETSFDIVRNWLSSCEKNHRHPKCARSAEAPLPRRVIELFRTRDGQHPLLQLRETRGEPAKYIALSHRWGKANPKTTTDNLFKMYAGFTFESLPKTYQDTITCAQRLEVRYVWIDSLCIIQNSHEDWDQESAKMGDIYENAYLVVDAAGSNGEERGFLEERLTEYIGYRVGNLGFGGTSEIIVQVEMPHSYGNEEWYNNNYPEIGMQSMFRGTGSTSSRAWCMQEVSLARRTLSFHRFEMAWECHSQMACECGFYPKPIVPTGLAGGCNGEIMSTPSSETNGGLTQKNFNVKKYKRRGFLSHFLPSCVCEYTRKPFAFLGNLKLIFEEWRLMIIPQYTSRQLSVSTDRLPALSAMAKVVANQHRPEAHVIPDYLAGIWRDDIQLGLLWSVGAAAPLPSAYIGPSFSWASVNEPVSYAITGPIFVERTSDSNVTSSFGDVGIELIDAHVELLGSNRFGQVKSAYICIRGLATMVRASFDRRRFIERVDVIGMNQGGFFRPDTNLQRIDIQHKGKSYSTVNRSRKPQNEDLEAHLKGVLVADAHCQFKAENEKVHNFAILVLGQVITETGELAYQRLGLAMIETKHDESQEWLDGLTSEEFLII